jgi:hypothetical protein
VCSYQLASNLEKKNDALQYTVSFRLVMLDCEDAMMHALILFQEQLEAAVPGDDPEASYFGGGCRDLGSLRGEQERGRYVPHGRVDPRKVEAK